MAQKFVSHEDAAKQLGISKDRLNDLREDNKLRAYRDGAGWKYRAEDIEKFATEGIPASDPSGSDLTLDLEDSPPSAPAASVSDIDISAHKDEPGGDVSDIALEDLDEPTLPADAPGDDAGMELTLGDDDLADSILLSETELGESTDRPPSTIIGKAEMAADMDLEIASESDPKMSDVKLAPTASNVFAGPARSDAVLDTEPPSLSDNFGDLDELEIDLEAESSRILSPEDISKAKQAAASAAKPKPAEPSDLELAASDSSLPGGALDSAVGSGGALSGLSSLELEGSDPEDDEVLGEGSDITLSSESSGINIISPSDSGLALDEVPLELSGASASPLDLGKGSDDVELETLEAEEEAAAPAAKKKAEPFALTPFGEEAGDEDEDSSQIIPLDEMSEEDATGGLLGAGEAASLGDDFATAGLGGGAMAPIETVSDTPFSVFNVVGLSFCLILLSLCGMMMFDLMRNIWAWDGVYNLNSSLMEVINPFLS